MTADETYRDVVHNIGVEDEAFGNTIYPRHRYWPKCECGWKAPFAFDDKRDAFSYAAKHRVYQGLVHDIEVEESGIFARVVCSCGHYVGGWHPMGDRTFHAHIRGDDNKHHYAMKNLGAA